MPDFSPEPALTKTMVISSDLTSARQVERTILSAVESHGYDEAATFAIRLALEEGLNNAIRHGNGYDPEKTVEVGFRVDAERVEISITDQGQGFDPGSIPDPRSDENLEKPTGRGIMLIRAYMDEVGYNKRGNRMRMVKRNTKSPSR